jgi:hypothetical protein
LHAFKRSMLTSRSRITKCGARLRFNAATSSAHP